MSPLTILPNALLILLKFTFKGVLFNIFLTTQLLISYPIHFIICALFVFTIYRLFIFLGFNQKLSIKLSSPYLNGQYYLSQLHDEIQDPHHFYHLEPGLFSRPMYCFVCDGNVNGLTGQGLCCDICSFTVHTDCVKDTIRTSCKAISTFNSLDEALDYAKFMAGRNNNNDSPQTISSNNSANNSANFDSQKLTNLFTSTTKISSPSNSQQDSILKTPTKINTSNTMTSPLMPSTSMKALAPIRKKAQNVDLDLPISSSSIPPTTKDCPNPRESRLESQLDQSPAAKRTRKSSNSRSRGLKMKNDPDFDPEEKITTKYVRKQRNTSRTRRSIHKIVDITDDDISDDDEVDGVDGVDDNEGKKKGNNVEKIEKKIVKQITNIIPPPPPPAKTTTTTPTTTPTYFPSSSPQDFQFSHHWVQGNHSSISDICFLCGSAVGSVFYRDGMHCLWCGLHVHEHCLHDRQLTSDLPLIPQVSPTSRSDTPAFSTHVDLHCCNLGSLAKAIIPPHCIYPGEGYTVPLAKYQIAANFTHEAIAAEKISRGEVALPPSSFNVNPKLDFPQLFKFTLPLWCYPLLVIINRKSGGNGGVEKMHDFVECLNPLQVWDLSVHPAELPLTLFKQSGYPFRVLVCGGDGTISSVLHSIDHVFGITPGTSANEYYTNPQLVTTDGGFSITIPNNNTINTNKNQKHSLSDTPTVPPPACAVLPLGTGNDLAQVLGWGGRNPTATPRQILSQIISGRLAVLDRWNVKLIPNPTPPVDLGPLPQPPIQWAIGDVICRAIQPFVDWLSPIFPLFMPVPSKPCDDLDGIMNNYVGFGLDAVIAHQFADLRKKYPHFFTSQAGNKLWYTRVGFGQWIYPVIRNGLKEAPYTTRVFVDGVELQGLETLQGVVCMGIKSFGGGICFWGDRARDENTAETDPTSGGKFQPPALDDGMFELIGFESSLHMAMIQTGSALPRRLAQGRRLEVEILGKLPMQIDGESWGVRENCRVIVELRTQSLMIVPLHSGPTQTQSDNLGYSPLTQEINVTNMLHEVMQDSIQTGVISSLQSSQLMIGFTKKFTKANPSSHFYPPSHDLD